MSVPLNPPAQILVLPEDLKQQVKTRTQLNLSQLVKKLSGTVFYNDSPALISLKSTLGEVIPGTSVDVPDTDEEICQKFTKYVPFTTYDEYYPYISRFIVEHCRESEIEHLLAPGLPDFIGHTSGTSGPALKYFPKYLHPFRPHLPRWDSTQGAQTMKLCQIGALGVERLIPVTGRNGESLLPIPLSIVSIGGARMQLGIGSRDDADVVTKKAWFMTSPWAAWYLPTYNCSIHAHAFFGILDKSLSSMMGTAPTLVTDAITVIRAQWDDWTQAIATGILPNFPDLPEERRQQLQAHLKPDLVRAEELRLIDTSKEGWLKEIWPALGVIRTPLGGPYAMTIPKIRYNFGPTVILQSPVFAATESMVGTGYDSMNTNLYRLDSSEHIELLDVEKEYLIDNISQPWEVEVGKRYEVCCTNRHGLWRYMLQDIVEVVGFSPTDGQPLIKYVERKGVGFRVGGEFLSQENLQEAVRAAESVLGNVVEFTVVPHERDAVFVAGYEFLLELDGEPGPDANLARDKLHEHLCLNEGYKHYAEVGDIVYPTIRILAPGTFSAYREWKGKATGSAAGQIKIPCTISDPETKEWLLTKAVKEL